MEFPLNPLEVTLALASLATWAVIARRMMLGEPAVEYLPRRPVPWGVMEVVALVGIFFLSLVVAFSVVGIPTDDKSEAGSLAQTSAAMLGMACGSLLFVAAGMVLLVKGRNATRADLGLPASPGEAARDVALGVFGFLAALVPVFTVHAAATQYFPYDHPLLDMLKHEEGSWIWLIAALAAVVAAPISEEFFFRLVLQSWLEKIELAMWVAEQRAVSSAESEGNPFASPSDGAALPPIDTSQLAPGIFPMFFSAFLWAMMHLGQGPAPVPLFIMGLILGYIFRETHRILPCIVLHMLFNGLSVGVYWWMQHAEPQASLLGST